MNYNRLCTTFYVVVTHGKIETPIVRVGFAICDSRVNLHLRSARRAKDHPRYQSVGFQFSRRVSLIPRFALLHSRRRVSVNNHWRRQDKSLPIPNDSESAGVSGSTRMGLCLRKVSV
jgi:hypothetical protein